MPKYYCRSGDFRLLCDAPDPVAAGRRLVARAMDAMGAGGAGGLGFLVAVSERGHNDQQAGMLPTIPLAREVSAADSLSGFHDLYALDDPAEMARRFGLDLRAMPPGGRDWLLGRDSDGEPPSCAPM